MASSNKKPSALKSTYPISQDKQDNPKLYARVTEGGKDTLFLWYYNPLTRKRSKEALGLSIKRNPTTSEDKAQNKETLRLAKAIRAERQKVLESGGAGEDRSREDFLQWAEGYLCRSHTSASDCRILRIALQRFKDFLAKYHPACAGGIEARAITPEMMKDFTAYLKTRSEGEGAHSIYSRFKRMVNAATEEGLFERTPCQTRGGKPIGISIPKSQRTEIKKAVLTPEEVQRLTACHFTHERPEIRRAFLFTIASGIRFCDIKELKYSNVNRADRKLTFTQSKTEGAVTLPLDDHLLQLIGKGEPDENIFSLPSFSYCLRYLKDWAAMAGIDKKLTWHSGRHTFGTNLAAVGANPFTIMELMGHSSISMTERYVHAAERMKEDAMAALHSAISGVADNDNNQ